jgi:hypothetical protein
MAIVSHGALFRGGAEGHTVFNKREERCLIGMPAIFYGTSIPLVLA